MADSVTITAGFHDGTDGNDNLLTSVGEWNVALQQDRTTLYSSGARGFGGDDTISNNGYLENILFDGGAGNDSIVNGGYYHRVNNVTLLGGAGDDRIETYGDNAIINAGDGDNAIRNYGDKATILGGAGNDSISNYGDGAIITAGDGADTITSSGNDVTIDAGDGDDTVWSNGANITVHGGQGNDSLSGNGVSSLDSKIFLDDTIGNNYFHISQSTNATIQAGAGDDIINSDGHNENLLINAGDGANSITSHFDNNITINAADGNDTIKFYDGNGILIQAGDGANYIYSYNYNLADIADFTILSGAGKDTVSTYGPRTLIVSGAGNDSITHVGANSTIQGGDGDDYINNHDGGRDYSTNPTIGANNLVEGGAGNDSIYNACNNVTVNGGTGDDYISSGAVDGALLLGGDGNDSLYNTGNINREFPTNTTLNGGNGDDFIDNLGNNVTINGGSGNDTISLRTGRGPGNTYSGSENVLINYTFGDGNDFIEGFNETSTLSISGGGEFSSLISGNDVEITVDDGSILLQDAANLNTLNIIGTYDTTPTALNIVNYDSDITITGTDLNDTVLNDGGNNVMIIGDGGNDSIITSGFNITVSGGEGDDYVQREWGVGTAYVYTGGNDTLKGFDDNDATALVIADAWTSQRSDDSTVIINVDGKGTITLIDCWEDNLKIVSSLAEVHHYNLHWNDDSNTTFTGTSGDDYLWNGGNKVKVNALGGDDYIDNDGSNSTVDAGAGNDFVGNWDGTNNLIRLGDGNDIFQSNTGNYTVDGGQGDDTIRSWEDGASDISINGGTGNDFFHNNSNHVTIDAGEGNDFIGNWGSNAHHVSINAGDGNDTIENNAENVTIDAGAGNDIVYNGGDNVSVDGGAGNDTIESYCENNTLAGGAGDDSIYTDGAHGTVFVYGGGNDTINGFRLTNNFLVIEGHSWSTLRTDYDTFQINVLDGKNTVGSILLENSNSPNAELKIVSSLKDVQPYNLIVHDNFSVDKGKDNASLVGTSGKDYINNFGWKGVTIKAGAGNDIIENAHGYNHLEGQVPENAYIDAGAGNDDISNSGINTTILAGDGDDTINNGGENVTINGGDGNDSIENAGFNVSIAGGKGDDTVRSYEAGFVYVYKSGDGNDFIEGLGVLDTLVIDGASYTTVNSGDDLLVKVGQSTITVGGAANSQIHITSSLKDIKPVNVIINEEEGVSVNGTDNPNWIRNYGSNVTINGGKLSDDIWNVGNNVIINGGDGRDKILNNGGKNILLDAGAGNDSIHNFKGEIWNEETQQFDTISPDNSTLLGGAGNDFIDNEGVNTSINGGAGNDHIRNCETRKFDSATQTSIIVRSPDNTTIEAGAGNDNISNGGENVTFVYNTGDGNDTINGFNETSTLDLGGAMYSSKTSGENITITVGTGSILLRGAATLDNLNIIGEKAAATWTLNGTTATFGDLITLSGVKSLDGISLSGNVVTVGKNSLNGKAVELTGDGYTLALGSDVPTSAAENPGAFTNFANGTATFTTNAAGDFYTLNGNKITYTAATAGKSITIKGLAKNLTLNDGELDGITAETSNGVTTFKISESALTDSDVTITGDNCKLELDDYTAPAEVPATFANGVYTQAHTPAHYTATDEKISYVKASDGGSFTITGLADEADIDDGITVEGKTVTLSEAALNGETVTLTTTDGYKLAIAGDVPTSSKKIAATWTESDDGFTYTAAGTSAYYKLSSNKLTFTPAKGGEQFTLTGIADTKGVKVSGKKVTVGKAALGDSDITLTTEDGFTLALDKSVTAAKKIKSGWTSKKGVYTYTAPGTTAGYVPDGDTITYSEPVGGETFTISGLKNTSDVTVEDYVVTIGAGSLNSKKVTFSGDDFTVELADDVPTSADEVDGGFTSVAKGTATYRTAHVSEAYTLGDGEITYTAAVGGQDVKISNLDKTATEEEVADAIDIVEGDDGLQITFMDAEVLTTKAPTISAPKGVEYTVAVDEALSTAEESLKWNTKSTAATLSANTGATYTVKGNKVVYTKGKTSTAAVLTGLVANTNLATPEENVITLDAENLGTKTSLKSNAGGYSIELTGNMSGKTFVGSAAADTIDVAATGALVDGGKGNDQFTISGASVTILSSAGNDTTNFADGLTVSLSGTTTVKELEQTDSGVQLTFSNKATLNVTDVTDTFEVIGKKQTFTVDTDKFSLAESLTFGKGSVTVNADFTGALTPNDDIYLGGKLSTVTTIDASAVTEGISIKGNAKANVIYGGAGDDTLWGDKGNDTLIGGDGSDTFIYNSGEGKDVVLGFTDDDLLEITGSNFTTSYNSSKNEIALKVGKGSLTLKNFTAENFNINGEVYQISGNKLVK